jgi:hypothetical protein
MDHINCFQIKKIRFFYKPLRKKKKQRQNTKKAKIIVFIRVSL